MKNKNEQCFCKESRELADIIYKRAISISRADALAKLLKGCKWMTMTQKSALRDYIQSRKENRNGT